MVIGLGLGAALVAGVAFDPRTPTGLRVDGETLAPTSDPAAELERRAERWLGGEVILEAGRVTEVLRRDELGARLDVAAAAAALLALGRGPAGLYRRARALTGHLDVVLARRVDADVLDDALLALAPRARREPLAADPGLGPLDGVELDIAEARELVRAALLRGEGRIELPLRTLRPPVPLGPLPTVTPLALVGSYRTRFRVRGSEGPRAANIRRATEALDGVVLPAGARLSFNDVVGPRSIERGFRVAHVIAAGEMVDGVGGGVCQVASTLFAAAYLAGLRIVEARPHSRPLPYIPAGLDATVVDGAQDLVVENDLGTTLVVRARAASGVVTIELHARAAPREVEWRRIILGRDPFGERIVVDPATPPGATLVAEEGVPGLELTRIRRIGGREEREHIIYPPTDRVLRVGPALAPSADARGPEGAVTAEL